LYSEFDIPPRIEGGGSPSVRLFFCKFNLNIPDEIMRRGTRHLIKWAFPILAAISVPLFVAVVFTDQFSRAHWVWEALFLADGIAEAIVVIPFRRQIDRDQRLKRGLCPQCGYDLRATPERCPECGTIPTTD
jgi:hypothetical protein